MKFYMVWDKTKEAYVTTNNSYGARTSSPRIYATHRHAAAAATNWTPDYKKVEVEGQRWPQHIRYTKEERQQLRDERFEVHCYETDTFEVVS